MEQCVFDRDLSGTYLFISFDLVNSTAFKLQDDSWPPLFNQFFDYCRLKTKEYFPGCFDWKMVGDEILFYMPVSSMNAISDAPSRVFTIMNRCIDFINLKAETKGILSVKSIIWSAYMKEQRHFGSGSSGDNYLLKTVVGNESILDFLGPDIDTGFRAGSYSIQGKLLVGAQLAALLYKNDSQFTLAQNLRIVSFEKLKGVWNGRHYPIIWYHESWDSPEEMFVYDESLVSDMVFRIQNRNIAENSNISRITKVFRDLYKENELQKQLDGIEEFRSNNDQCDIDFTPPLERLSELQLVALCINEKSELLIGRRQYNQTWDFGCTSLQMYRTIEESLEQGYRDDFGVEIQEINDEYPPVATYSTLSECELKTVPGIMLLASVLKDDIREDSLDSFKYDTFRWISQDEIGDVVEAVPGFDERAVRAFELYEKLHSEEES